MDTKPPKSARVLKDITALLLVATVVSAFSAAMNQSIAGWIATSILFAAAMTCGFVSVFIYISHQKAQGKSTPVPVGQTEVTDEQLREVTDRAVDLACRSIEEKVGIHRAEEIYGKRVRFSPFWNACSKALAARRLGGLIAAITPIKRTVPKEHARELFALLDAVYLAPKEANHVARWDFWKRLEAIFPEMKEGIWVYEAVRLDLIVTRRWLPDMIETTLSTVMASPEDSDEVHNKWLMIALVAVLGDGVAAKLAKTKLRLG